MNKLWFALALVAVGGTALLLRRQLGARRVSLGGAARARRLGQSESAVRLLINHPTSFGAGAGLVTGLLAVARGKKVSLAANLVTAAVVGISEGMLYEDPSRSVEVAGLAALGHAVGLAPFTRFEAKHPALIERTT